MIACKTGTKEQHHKADKLNCWEFMQCGRGPGSNVADISICPASADKVLDGINSGRNGGRACWATVGTFCNGHVQGTFASKLKTCLSCNFYKLVHKEEGATFKGFEMNLLTTWYS